MPNDAICPQNDSIPPQNVTSYSITAAVQKWRYDGIPFLTTCLAYG